MALATLRELKASLAVNSRLCSGSEHDLCDISIPKAAAAGPRQRDGVRGGGRGRPHRAAARQSHLVVPLAQRVAAPAATRPLHRPGPDRHGRLRQAARQRPRLVSFRRAPPLPLVIHDWGSALGFDWANRHREAVKGIAFMEAIVAPQGRDHWDKMGMRPALEALRSEAGEAMVLQNNYFIEEILPNAILRKLSDE